MDRLKPPHSTGIYIHVPFCEKRCIYCSFYSTVHGKRERDAFVHTLCQELAFRYDGSPISTLYFGGGTPSQLDDEEMESIFAALHRYCSLIPDAEITFEANPDDITPQKIRHLQQLGVNRISLGVQSFDAAQLHTLGRIHSRDEAVRAVAIAEKAGFQRINLDLMFALPGQDVAGALTDLTQAAALAPEHISWYQLTLEPNTAFYANPPALPDSDTQIDIYEAGSAHLSAHGYRQYETSAWRAGAPCRHNLNYWQYGDYLGIGAGAHGKQTRDGIITRSSKYRAPGAYQKAAGNGENPYRDQRFTVPRDEQPFEIMMNALRLKDGIPTAYLHERSALTLDDLRPTLARLIAQGLIDPAIEQRLKTTERGFALLNNVLDAFL